ncbi:hypothetical protein [Streptomyces xanthophaeus]|uniref:hypothetical protein n=1 Tax=Streptomyces xanthophaeus TaxID=67385 RepID=UPI0036477603
MNESTHITSDRLSPGDVIVDPRSRSTLVVIDVTPQNWREPVRSTAGPSRLEQALSILVQDLHEGTERRISVAASYEWLRGELPPVQSDDASRSPLPVRPLPTPPVELYTDPRGVVWRLAEDGQDGRMFVLGAVNPASCPRWVWATEAELVESVGPLVRLDGAA